MTHAVNRIYFRRQDESVDKIINIILNNKKVKFEKSSINSKTYAFLKIIAQIK